MSAELHTVRAQRIAAGIGVAALGALAIGVLVSPPGAMAELYGAWLVGWQFWIAVSVGSLSLLMLHHLVGGRWGFSIQRILEAATGTLPAMAVLFVPVLVGASTLFEWSHAEVVAADPVLQHKAPYLNLPFWSARAVAYFAIWIGLGMLLRTWSVRQDTDHRPRVDRLRALSGPGLVLAVLTVSFASIDWGMSLDPHWFSTIYGLVFVVAHALSALAFVVVVLVWLRQHESVARVMTADRVHELGKLMLAFVMLWAYMNVSQFLIIWMGNLPEEIGWYVHRTHGGWQWLSLAVVLGLFALPFFLLLSRPIKRSLGRLVWVAALVLVMRWVDLIWMVRPSSHHPELTITWLDAAAWLANGGFWLLAFFWSLSRAPMLPQGDPRFEEAMTDHGGH